MFRPASLYIGLRYTRAKRRNHFISFISLVSMLGIALGVAVLITVLSVMNGFDYEIRSKIFGMANQVNVTNTSGHLTDWQALAKQVEKTPHVVSAAPFVNGQAMIISSGRAFPVMMTGILPEQELKVSNLQSQMQQGSLLALKPGKFGVVLGDSLADSLNVSPGDKIAVFTPRATASPLGIIPTVRSFIVVGVFHIDGNANYERSVAFINLQDAQLLYKLNNSVSALRLKVSDLYTAPQVTTQLEATLPAQYLVSDWTDEFGSFFKAIRMEKTMMFVILLLIIAVAAFNLVSTLVMVVTDKRAEIAILKTLGATPKMIMSTFIVQGSIVGFIGTLLGVVGGILLALNVTKLVDVLQQVLHVNLISSGIYFVNFLPSRLEWPDVWHISAIALLLSLLATIYPAWQASRTRPAEALRYE